MIMSHYLTINYRAEVIRRIQFINSIKENLIDTTAELEEVKKRDGLSRTKSATETSTYSGSADTTHIATILSMKENVLQLKESEYKTILTDFNRGWRLLDESEKSVLDLRYNQNMTAKKVADILGFSEQNIYKIQERALRKMENQITKF